MPTDALHPVIARPKVPVHRTDDGVRAECRHCPWTLTGSFPAEIAQTVAHHRVLHQTGALEVTPRA